MIRRIIAITSVLFLFGCASGNLVTSGSPQSPEMRQQRWDLMTGKWYGSQPVTEGGYKAWIVIRQPNGVYHITFRVYNERGDYEEQTEVGEWGVDGPVYFSIFKGWLENGVFSPADETDPLNRDAFKIISLTSELFIYEGVQSGFQYKVKKVPLDFEFPDWPQPSPPKEYRL